jgi:stage V sporulation protein R
VGAIHDAAGYTELRSALSLQYDLGAREPNIQVWNVNLKGDRTLILRHTPYRNRPLGDSTLEVLKHTARLWGFGVRLESVSAAGDTVQEWSVAGASQ